MLSTIDASQEPATLTRAADQYLALGKPDRAATLLSAASEHINSPWERAAVAGRFLRLAEASGSSAHLDEALRIYALAVEAEPDSATLRHDYAAALFAAGQDQAAIDELTHACELAPTRAIFPRRLALLLRQIGRHHDADAWDAEANARPDP